MTPPVPPGLPDPDRREFLTSLAALSGAAAFAGEHLPASTLSRRQSQPVAESWDLSWLDQLKGKHRQVFDLSGVDGMPLHVVANYLDACEELFGLRHPDINTVVGIGFRAFPINAGDALWVKHHLGEKWKVKDPTSGSWATHNVFLEGGATPRDQKQTVRALQSRGTIFWQCNNGLLGVAERLASEDGGSAEAIYTELRAGLLSGVRMVPTHTLLVGLCQERGCAYEKL